MIINSAPDNIATLGNVAQVSEFRIRNSAKAFGILSSGLYANKIRAIIRELGCNAVDSHVAAKRTDVPFDVHLPTQLRPHFAIRDYGTGLSHDEVVNIYTTYFESTKTQSNDFIGALGLGSKSPFSYTDNFTVIAIKDGIKGVYSAFINEHGVPSVAVMSSGPSDEPAGVEVKFAVTDSHDFYKFVREASSVFAYFPVKPNFIGAEVDVEEITYKAENIVPNIHQRDSGRGGRNRAIMGNIAYPIEMPHGHLGTLEHIDNNALDIYFNIGDVEFQASREGLQYTVATVAAIKAKYQEVADALTEKFALEADAVPNVWDRVKFIETRGGDGMWRTAAMQYISKNKPPFLRINGTYIYREEIEFEGKDLASKFNIKPRMFVTRSSWPNRSASELEPRYGNKYHIEHRANMFFVNNPESKKIWEQSKYHFKTALKDEDAYVWVLYPADPAKPMNVKAFMKAIHNPPDNRLIEVDQLTKRERVKKEKTDRKINLLTLHIERRYRIECTWQPVTVSPADMDPAVINYYVPIKGYQAFNKAGKEINIKDYYIDMIESHKESFRNFKVYGVRKDDLELVQSLPNWILLDDFLEQELGSISKKDYTGIVVQRLDRYNSRMYSHTKILKQLDAKSPFRLFAEGVGKVDGDQLHKLENLIKVFAPGVNLEQLRKDAEADFMQIQQRYPMLKHLRGGEYDEPAVVEYIQFVDQHKGMN
jgi:hypothetical protein